MQLTSNKGFIFDGFQHALKVIDIEEIKNNDKPTGLFRITSENPKFKKIAGRSTIEKLQKQAENDKLEAEKAEALAQLTAEEVQEVVQEVTLKKKTVKELQAILTEKGTPFEPKAKKDELIALIIEVEKAWQEFDNLTDEELAEVPTITDEEATELQQT